jgi:MFS transporter, DHA1 family, inner membrane transport protein
MSHSVDHPKAIIAAALMISLGVLAFNASPPMIGAAAVQLQLDNKALGFLLVPALIASAMVSLSMIAWIRRVNWRKVVIAGGLLQAVGMSIASLSETYSVILIGFFVGGLGGGTLYAVAMTCLSDTKNLERAFGIAAFAQTLTTALALYALPVWIVPRWGFGGCVAVMAVLGLLVLSLVRWAPVSGNPRERSHDTAEPAKTPSARSTLTAMAALFLFCCGISAMWVFYELYAVHLGFSRDFTAGALASGAVFGGLGGLVPALAGDRWRSTGCLAVSSIGIVLVLITLHQTPGQSGLVAATVGFKFFWSMSLPYYFSAIARLDINGNLFAAIPAVVALSSAGGSMVAGAVYSMHPSALLLFTALAVVFAWLLLLLGQRQQALGLREYYD